jgi:prephenate dehydratase
MTKVAIQGINGSYSESAARQLVNDCELVPCMSFALAVAAVEAGAAKWAVLPLRNKLVGDIAAVHKLLEASSLRSLKEQTLKIEHVLAGGSGASVPDLTEVVSHPEALKQCRRFLGENPQLSVFVGDDTASSLRDVVSVGMRHRAAIASKRAAAIYDASILLEQIADDVDNWTVFGLYSR